MIVRRLVLWLAGALASLLLGLEVFAADRIASELVLVLLLCLGVLGLVAATSAQLQRGAVPRLDRPGAALSGGLGGTQISATLITTLALLIAAFLLAAIARPGPKGEDDSKKSLAECKQRLAKAEAARDDSEAEEEHEGDPADDPSDAGPKAPKPDQVGGSNIGVPVAPTGAGEEPAPDGVSSDEAQPPPLSAAPPSHGQALQSRVYFGFDRAQVYRNSAEEVTHSV